MGKKSEALNLLLSTADSIEKAVEFCLDQADSELWLELIDLSIVNPKFIKDLLKTVGNYVDPLVIIKRIPEGMEIPELRDAIQIVLRDSTDRQRMWKSAEVISSQDGLNLVKKLFKLRSAGHFVDKGLHNSDIIWLHWFENFKVLKRNALAVPITWWKILKFVEKKFSYSVVAMNAMEYAQSITLK